ncbi:MAG: MotA/TolQ/ExbB proton channel family protein [Gammaproteobacteria bacterium]|nr:MotA/TolQ/ExbB proton channel family protein [Gammaproteobacteria bacterium]
MFEILLAGGWVLYFGLLPLSVLGMAIIAERFWSLRSARIAPAGLISQVWQWYKSNSLDEQRIQSLGNNSPLGRVLAAGIANRQFSREVMRESMETVGRQVAHELNRYLTMLGSIAAGAPLVGLLGTVFGMIRAFADISAHGVGNPQIVGGGISEALINTAAGLTIAIPALFFYRFFRARVETMVMKMEDEAGKLVDIFYSEKKK